MKLRLFLITLSITILGIESAYSDDFIHMETRKTWKVSECHFNGEHYIVKMCYSGAVCKVGTQKQVSEVQDEEKQDPVKQVALIQEFKKEYSCESSNTCGENFIKDYLKNSDFFVNFKTQGKLMYMELKVDNIHPIMLRNWREQVYENEAIPIAVSLSKNDLLDPNKTIKEYDLPKDVVLFALIKKGGTYTLESSLESKFYDKMKNYPTAEIIELNSLIKNYLIGFIFDCPLPGTWGLGS